MKTTEQVFYPVIFFSRLVGMHPFPHRRKVWHYLSQAYSAAMLTAAGIVVVAIARDIHSPSSSIVEYENVVMKLCALIFSVLILLTIVAVLLGNFFRAGQFQSLLTDLDLVANNLDCKEIYFRKIQKTMVQVEIMYVKDLNYSNMRWFNLIQIAGILFWE
jgi:RecA-family ATPase